MHGEVEYPKSCTDPDSVEVTVRAADGEKIAEVDAPIREARPKLQV